MANEKPANPFFTANKGQGKRVTAAMWKARGNGWRDCADMLRNTGLHLPADELAQRRYVASLCHTQALHCARAFLKAQEMEKLK